MSEFNKATTNNGGGGGGGVNMGSGTIFMQEYDVAANICMDSSSSSCSSMQPPTIPNLATAQFTNAFNNPPNIDHHHSNIFDASLFNLSACLQQEGVGGVENSNNNNNNNIGGYFGDYGVMMELPYVMGLENDLSVPGLEGRGVDEHNNYGVSHDQYVLDKKLNTSISTIVNNNNNKVEELVGVGNHWEGESFKMGELDWEGLLANVSSLPYLDFQVE